MAPRAHVPPDGISRPHHQPALDLPALPAAARGGARSPRCPPRSSPTASTSTRRRSARTSPTSASSASAASATTCASSRDHLVGHPRPRRGAPRRGRRRRQPRHRAVPLLRVQHRRLPHRRHPRLRPAARSARRVPGGLAVETASTLPGSWPSAGVHIGVITVPPTPPSGSSTSWSRPASTRCSTSRRPSSRATPRSSSATSTSRSTSSCCPSSFATPSA